LKGQRIDGKIDKEKAEKIQLQEEVVKLLKEHLKECEDLLSRGDTKGLYEKGSSSSSGNEEPGKFKEQKVSYLASIDDPQFDVLNRQKKKDIDDGLDILYDKVREFRKIQESIGVELKDQDHLLVRLQGRAEDAHTDMKVVNVRLNDTLKKVRSMRNLCCDIFLFLVILGIIGAIYFLVVKK